MTPPPQPWWELVSPDLVEQYADLVRDTRAMQQQYRATLCPMLRRELPDLERRLDVVTAQIGAAIAAARAAAEPAPDLVLAEGGVA